MRALALLVILLAGICMGCAGHRTQRFRYRVPRPCAQMAKVHCR
jgi:hypothetical protein